MNPSSGSQGFPKSIRITKRSGYLAMRRKGRPIKSSCFVLLWRGSQRRRDRIGITVSRRVGGAVVRNRVKRLVKEAFRVLPPRPPALDMVIIARPAAAAADHTTVSRQVAGLIAQAKTRAGLKT